MPQSFEQIVLEAQPVVSAKAIGSEGTIGETIMALLSTAQEALAAADSEPSGAPFARFDPLENGNVEVEAGFPVAESIDTSDTPATCSELPGGKAIVTVHQGSYEGLALAHARLHIFLVEEALNPRALAWEFYEDDPEEVPLEDVRTRIVQPID